MGTEKWVLSVLVSKRIRISSFIVSHMETLRTPTNWEVSRAWLPCVQKQTCTCQGLVNCKQKHLLRAYYMSITLYSHLLHPHNTRLITTSTPRGLVSSSPGVWLYPGNNDGTTTKNLNPQVCGASWSTNFMPDFFFIMVVVRKKLCNSPISKHWKLIHIKTNILWSTEFAWKFEIK